jgi:hypothetical protein
MTHRTELLRSTVFAIALLSAACVSESSDASIAPTTAADTITSNEAVDDVTTSVPQSTDGGVETSGDEAAVLAETKALLVEYADAWGRRDWDALSSIGTEAIVLRTKHYTLRDQILELSGTAGPPPAIEIDLTSDLIAATEVGPGRWQVEGRATFDFGEVAPPSTWDLLYVEEGRAEQRGELLLADYRAADLLLSESMLHTEAPETTLGPATGHVVSAMVKPEVEPQQDSLEIVVDLGTEAPLDGENNVRRDPAFVTGAGDEIASDTWVFTPPGEELPSAHFLVMFEIPAEQAVDGGAVIIRFDNTNGDQSDMVFEVPALGES